MRVTHRSSVLTQLLERLEREMDRVREEIRNYPAPIPACDAQYNHLLESRERLSAAIARVRELGDGDAAHSPELSIDAFLDSPMELGEALESEIRTLIGRAARHAEGDS